MEMANVLQLCLEDSANLDTIVQNITARLQRELVEKSDLLRCREDLILLSTVLNLVNRKRRNGLNDVLQTQTVESFNIKVVMPLDDAVADSEGRLNSLLEPLCRICCEHYELAPGRSHWLMMKITTALEMDGDRTYCFAATRTHAIQMLSCLFSLSGDYSSMKDLLRSSTDDILEFLPQLWDTEHLAKFAFVTKQLLGLHDDNSGRLRTIWEKIADSETALEKSLLFLCTLADYFVAPIRAASDDVYRDSRFWNLIQRGLCDWDTLSRKRALYSLKRAIDNQATVPSRTHPRLAGGDNATVPLFHWSSESAKDLAALWEDYILITEMIEEKQSHIIKAVLPRWQNVVAATYLKPTPLMHTSWLLVLLKRTAVNSRPHLIQWGVEQLLNLDPTLVPLQQQEGDDFLVANLAEMLNQSVLYQRDPTSPTSECPSISTKLETFLRRYWSAFDDNESRTVFFRALLTSVENVSWSGVPLMFLMKAFAALPGEAVLDTASLDTLRNVCTKHIRTVYVKQRGAIQVFATQIMVKLIDPNRTTLFDVLKLLAVINADESYGRRSRVWTQLCDWLQSKPWNTTAELEVIVKTIIGTMGIENSYSTLPNDCLALGFAKLFYLHLDSGLVDAEHALGIILPLIEFAVSAQERVYLSRENVDKALAVIVQLLKLKTSSEPSLDRLLARSRESLLDYSRRRLAALTTSDEACLYLEAIRLCISTSTNKESMLEATVEKLSSHLGGCDSASSHEVLAGMMALQGLGECLKITDEDQSIKLRFPPLSQLVLNVNRPDFDCPDWSEIVSDAVRAKWRLVAYNLERGNETASEQVLEDCLSALDAGSDRLLEPVFRTLGQIFRLAKLDSERISCCIDICWRRLLECGSCPQAFWPGYDAFLSMAFQQILMGKEDLLDRLLSLTDEIHNAADDRNGLMYELSRHLTDKPYSTLLPFAERLVRMTMFGPIHKKGDKSVYEMNAYINTIEDLEPAVDETNRDDCKVRVVMTAFILKLSNENHSDERDVLLHSLVREMMEAWREITRTRRRHTFVNSLRHRQTHRLLTSILLLRKSLTDDEIKSDLIKFLCELLEQEGQPSVRFLAEWILVLILIEERGKWSMIWENLASNRDKKPAVQCSWMVVLTHVAKLIPPTERKDYLLRAIPTVLPLCMAHQFNPRIFGQACLLTLSKLCEEDGAERFSEVELILEGVHNFISMSGNSSRCTMTLLDHFSLVYHPQKDFSIESLFTIVPRLFGLHQDEWLTPDDFLAMDKDFGSRGVPLSNPKTRLTDCTPGAWKLRTEDSEAIEVTIGDVQRKITPWKRMFPEQQESPESHRNPESESGVLLVASLIDKPANLGGLCRTCEIFGASEFVLGSLSYVQDPLFIGLSVSAEKWIPITEVQPNFLRDYLLMQQREGYTLVGVEQTNNSQCLTEYKFPKKTLLLLGNEKEGIPVDLIQLLDVCVQIPQQGIIRSLNVHVCGALLMWEYRRQHLS